METIIQRVLRLLLDKFGAEDDCITVHEDSGHYRANIETSDPARLIGRNGSVLNSLQILLKNILWNQSSERVFVTVDVDDYRKSQEDRVLEKVEKTIEMMKEDNLSEIKLNPMSAYFRRIVHLWIASNFPDLTTESIGEKGARSIRVFYK